MEVINEILPGDITAIEQHFETDPGTPIAIVNLLKFKAQAEYDDQENISLTGEQAYQKYLDAVRQYLPQIGAREIFQGKPNFLLVGQVEALWDEVLIIQYPNRAALQQLNQFPEVQQAAAHRAAGLEGQLAIETLPA